MHGVLGLTTELAEIIEDPENIPNINQEIGDVLWYVALIYSGIGESMLSIRIDHLIISPTLSLGSIVGHRLEKQYIVARSLFNHLGVVADCVKRHIYYSTIDRTVELDLDRLHKAVAMIMSYMVYLSNDQLIECAILNIEKLRRRYPDKFDAVKAIHRNIQNEESIFETNDFGKVISLGTISTLHASTSGE